MKERKSKKKPFKNKAAMPFTISFATTVQRHIKILKILPENYHYNQTHRWQPITNACPVQFLRDYYLLGPNLSDINEEAAVMLLYCQMAIGVLILRCLFLLCRK